MYAVLARTGEGAAALGLSMFLVPADTPGVRIEPADLVAPRAFGHLHLDGVRLGADALLGRSGGGFAIALEVLDRFRMTVGAAAVGFARRAAHSALRHTRSRAIYGSRLSDLGTVRAALADMDVRLNAAGLLVARAAWEADRESRYQKHSAIAKLYATEAAQSVVDDCVQMFGAAGLVADTITERLYRQIRSLRIYEGASEVQRDVIAARWTCDALSNAARSSTLTVSRERTHRARPEPHHRGDRRRSVPVLRRPGRRPPVRPRRGPGPVGGRGCRVRHGGARRTRPSGTPAGGAGTAGHRRHTRRGRVRPSWSG
nr:hypothetical protein GCM10020092_076390 [Actinoplanes digitatis]